MTEQNRPTPKDFFKDWKQREALAEGKVVVVAGFQGVSTDKEITTLGRGGSDTTAVRRPNGVPSITTSTGIPSAAFKENSMSIEPVCAIWFEAVANSVEFDCEIGMSRWCWAMATASARFA
mgnify:CR=1 FL=1